jgi:hypothetical protein
VSDEVNWILQTERLTNIIRATEMERDAGDKAADNLRAEIERLKSLLTRAADALQDLDRFAFYCWSARNEKLPQLIAELRKAAQ